VYLQPNQITRCLVVGVQEVNLGLSIFEHAKRPRESMLAGDGPIFRRCAWHQNERLKSRCVLLLPIFAGHYPLVNIPREMSKHHDNRIYPHLYNKWAI
jgi:hypothetical protein